MAPRLQPTTVRLTDAEQTFLARLKIQGAATTSDKIRHLIKERSEREAAGQDFGAALSTANSLLAPLADAVKTAENAAEIHSQLVRRLIEWAPELLAGLLSQPVPEDADAETLRALEQALARQLVRLLDTALQLYVARESALYDPDVFGPRQLASLRRLCRMVAEESESE